MPEVENPYAPWRLPVLVPLWIIQLVLALVYLIAVPIIANHSYYGKGMDMRSWLVAVFAISSLVLIGGEGFLLLKKRLSTRNYLISQWIKSTIAGTIWVSITVFAYMDVRRARAGNFAMESFVLQHPAILASLWYGSRNFSKYGSSAGAEYLTNDAGSSEETPLLRESSGEI